MLLDNQLFVFLVLHEDIRESVQFAQFFWKKDKTTRKKS